MLSPMSKGLFHRVIALSGSPTMSEPLPHDQKNLAIKQAKILNCTTENMDKMFECLKQKPAKEFGNSVGKFAVGVIVYSKSLRVPAILPPMHLMYHAL